MILLNKKWNVYRTWNIHEKYSSETEFINKTYISTKYLFYLENKCFSRNLKLLTSQAE